MPNPLHICFSKLKSPSSSSSSSSPSKTTSAKHWKTKTPNLSNSSENTLLFNSLYDTPTTPLHHASSSSSSSSAAAASNTTSSLSCSTSSTSSSPSISESDGLDLSTILSSHRFFLSSPGHTNAIVEEATTHVGPGGIAVPTYSPNPYEDFRRSMEEMVVAQGLDDVRSHWDHLHELLLCYLALNRKNTHSFIISAFADLVVSLLKDSA